MAKTRRRSRPVFPHENDTRFLNVDLDIYSRTSLAPLVSALGRTVVVLYVGTENRRHSAHLELARTVRTPDALIRRFVRLIERLPRDARRLWNGAQRREFNIGIQAGSRPHASEFRVSPDVIQAAARVGGAIVTTVYAPIPRRTKSS